MKTIANTQVATATVRGFSQPAIGKVDEAIAPNSIGRVRYSGTYWFARFDRMDYLQTLQPGALVKVVGREGNTLLIGPWE